MSLPQHCRGTLHAPFCPEPQEQALETLSSRPHVLHTKRSPFFMSAQFAMSSPPFSKKYGLPGYHSFKKSFCRPTFRCLPSFSFHRIHNRRKLLVFVKRGKSPWHIASNRNIQLIHESLSYLFLIWQRYGVNEVFPLKKKGIYGGSAQKKAGSQ